MSLCFPPQWSLLWLERGNTSLFSSLPPVIYCMFLWLDKKTLFCWLFLYSISSIRLDRMIQSVNRTKEKFLASRASKCFLVRFGLLFFLWLLCSCTFLFFFFVVRQDTLHSLGCVPSFSPPTNNENKTNKGRENKQLGGCYVQEQNDASYLLCCILIFFPPAECVAILGFLLHHKSQPTVLHSNAPWPKQ